MKLTTTIYNQTCTCGREGCPVAFSANKSRRYANRDCSEYMRKKREAERAVGYRAKYSKRGPVVVTNSREGYRDGQTRKPSLDWPERRELIRAKYGVKLPEKGQ